LTKCKGAISIKRMANTQNLKPIKLTHEEAVKNGKAGGKKSVKVRREKRLLSQIYSDILAEKNNLPKGQDIQDIIKAVISRKDSSAVSMLKEIREATEGSKIKHEGGVKIVYLDKQDEKL